MQTIGTATLKDAMSCFTTGVTIVTTQFNGQDYGMTCNSFNTVSLDPPLVMWCIRKSSLSYEAYRSASGYVVSVLAASQQALAMKFTSGSQAERFDNVPTQTTTRAMKHIQGAAAWFDCTLEQTVDAGDHTILIGRVLSVGTEDVPCLAYSRRKFGVLSPI
jgi:flavin reductase (DIM6/NTAB) family NADH-FMN oxidoreductase RutF